MYCPNPVAFTIFGRSIYWYGVIIAAAVLLGIVWAYYEGKRKGVNPDSILDLALVAIPTAIVFARLYYVVFEWPRYAANPISALYIWEGGMAIYGGIIGGVLAALVFSKWKKIPFLKLADIAAPGIVIAQAIGRWGNFFNQEAYGRAVTDPALQWFPFSVYIENMVGTAEGPWHHATFFYEFVACTLIFVFLFFYRKHSRKDGNVFFWYLLLYGVARAFIEGLRTDSLYLYLGSYGVRISQILSIVLVIASAVVLIVRRTKKEEVVYIDPSLVMIKRDEDDAGEDAPTEESTTTAAESATAATESAAAPEETPPAGDDAPETEKTDEDETEHA